MRINYSTLGTLLPRPRLGPMRFGQLHASNITMLAPSFVRIVVFVPIIDRIAMYFLIEIGKNRMYSTFFRIIPMYVPKQVFIYISSECASHATQFIAVSFRS